MRASWVILLLTLVLLSSCSRQAPIGASVLQMRLVEASATVDTEPLTEDQTLMDPTRTRPETLNVRKHALLDHRAVRSATAQTEGVTVWVQVALTERGQKLFADITRQNVGRRLAIIADGKLMAAPRIEEAITGGEVMITGRFTMDQGRALAAKINDAVQKLGMPNKGTRLNSPGLQRSDP